MQGIINVKSPKLVYNCHSFSQLLVLGILWTLVFNNASVKNLSQLCEVTQSTLYHSPFWQQLALWKYPKQSSVEIIHWKELGNSLKTVIFTNFVYYRESIEINISQGKKPIKQSPEKAPNMELLLSSLHWIWMYYSPRIDVWQYAQIIANQKAHLSLSAQSSH